MHATARFLLAFPFNLVVTSLALWSGTIWLEQQCSTSVAGLGVQVAEDILRISACCSVFCSSSKVFCATRLHLLLVVPLLPAG